MKRLISTTLCLAVLVMAWLPGQCAWSGLGNGPGRSGFTPERPVVPMSTLWKYYYADQENDSTVAVAKGRVFFAAGTWLYCLDQDTGARLWEYRAKSFVLTSPLLIGDQVVIGEEIGMLHSIDVETGKVEWSKDLDGAIVSSPALYKNTLYIGTAGRKVLALKPDTGQQVWSYSTRGTVGLSVAVGNDVVVALDREGMIYGLDAASGKKLWSAQSHATLVVPPVVSGDMLYLVSGSVLYGLDLRGNLRWQAYSDRPIDHAPAVSNDALYITGSDGALYAMSARNGATRWTYSDPDILVTASPSVAGNVVLAAGSGGAIMALDAATGKLLWRAQTRTLTTDLDRPGAQSAASQPVFADGDIFLLSNDGNLSCFSPQAIDVDGPVIGEIGPGSRMLISGKLPLAIQARIFDEGSGLDPASIEVYLDGEKGSMTQDPRTGVYYFVVQKAKNKESLADGVHVVNVSAKDYRGNVTNVVWRFSTDKRIELPDRLLSERMAILSRMSAGSGTNRNRGQGFSRNRGGNTRTNRGGYGGGTNRGMGGGMGGGFGGGLSF